MKKISAVLLVLVLVGSVAFAGFTGSANVDLGYDFDTGVYGFSNGTSLAVDLVFHEALGEEIGEGDVYAEIKASVKFAFNNGNAGTLHAADMVDVSGSISSAKIIGKDWYVGILSALNAPNFATSAIDSKKLANTANDLGYSRASTSYAADLQPSQSIGKVAGVEVGFKDYVGSVGLVGNSTAGTYKVYGSITTPELEVADGLKLKVGGASFIADTGKGVSASAKGSFATDDYSASLAADVVYDGGLKADAAAQVAIEPVTVDAYYATGLYYNKVDQSVANYLSAKVSFKVDKFDIAVTGKDLINTTDLGAIVDFTATDEIAVGVNGGYTLTGGAWYAGGSVEYTAEKFVLSADATYDSSNALEVNLGVESEALVNGALLYASYGVTDILTAKGAVTVGAEISF